MNHDVREVAMYRRIGDERFSRFLVIVKSSKRILGMPVQAWPPSPPYLFCHSVDFQLFRELFAANRVGKRYLLQGVCWKSNTGVRLGIGKL